MREILPVGLRVGPMRRCLVAAAVVVVLAASPGCWTTGDEPDRDDQGNVVAPGDVSVFHLRVGDCTQDSTLGEVSSVDAIACDQPHAYEVFAVGQYQGSDYDATAIDTYAQTYCSAAFTGFVGRTVEESNLEVTYLTPTAESFEGGDREVTCLVGTGSEPTTGSLQGANR